MAVCTTDSVKRFEETFHAIFTNRVGSERRVGQTADRGALLRLVVVDCSRRNREYRSFPGAR